MKSKMTRSLSMLVLLVVSCCLVAVAERSESRSMRGTHRKDETQGHSSKEDCHGHCKPKMETIDVEINARQQPFHPVLKNDHPISILGLDEALHDLEKIFTDGKLSGVAETRGGSVLTFREQIDYDIRVATSPTIKRVCEIGFFCGQSAVIFLEANPEISVVSFDDLSYPKAVACSEYIQKRYPGRFTLVQGLSGNTVPDYIKKNSNSAGEFTGQKCDLVRTDARAEYELRRQDFTLMQPMMHCSTLILFNDICKPHDCHLYQAENCYWQFGTCNQQNPLFFEGPTMLFEELTRMAVVEKIDTFHLREKQFYKSWALGRAMCSNNAIVKVPKESMYKNQAGYKAQMHKCFTIGGCAEGTLVLHA